MKKSEGLSKGYNVARLQRTFGFSWNTKCTNNFKNYGYNSNKNWRSNSTM